jgi:hypothetical protein
MNIKAGIIRKIAKNAFSNDVTVFFFYKKGTWYKYYCVPVYVRDVVYDRQYKHKC